MLNNKTKKGAKSLSTPHKIIKILKLLIEQPKSIGEIIKTFEEDNVFITPESLSKYITTLRLSGCNIQKSRNKFYVKYPIFHLNDAEFETISNFDTICKNLNSKENYGEFQKFLFKLLSLTKDGEKYHNIHAANSTKNTGFEKTCERYENKIEIISKFLNDETQKVKMVFNNKEFTITPLKFHYFKDSICLLAYDIKQSVNRYFPLDKISDIKETPSAKSPVDFGLTTTFKITGRLKNAYTLREGEIISEFSDHIIVLNKKEDKDELFKRLLKYGNSCEILYPKTDREKFKNMVEDLIAKFSSQT